jgi:hypothetical protein
MRQKHNQNHSLKAKLLESTTTQTDNIHQTAQYIAEMLLELRNLAKAHQFTGLQALLEVSYYEAFTAANKITVPQSEIEHLQELTRISEG